MPVNKKSGQAGRVLIDGEGPSITKWTITVENDMQNTTASDDFNETTNQLWKSQAKGAYSASGSIEGKYDLTTDTGTAQTILAALFGEDPVMMVFSVTRTIDYGYGLFDLTNTEVSLEVEGEITFTADVKSSRTFTLGSPPVTP